MNEKVSQLRRLIAEASPRRQAPSAAQRAAEREYEYFAANEPVPAAMDMSPRAKAVREIMRIVLWRDAQKALTKELDRMNAASVSDLPDDKLESLLEIMRQIELCVETGAGSPYAPPAS